MDTQLRYELLIFSFGLYSLCPKDFVLCHFHLILHPLDVIGDKQVSLVVESNQRICGNELSFEVWERADAEVIDWVGMGLLVNHQRDKEAELAYLDGDGLDVDTIDAVLYQIEFAGVVGTVDILVEATFDVGHHLFAFLVCSIEVGL